MFDAPDGLKRLGYFNTFNETHKLIPVSTARLNDGVWPSVPGGMLVAVFEMANKEKIVTNCANNYYEWLARWKNMILGCEDIDGQRVEKLNSIYLVTPK